MIRDNFATKLKEVDEIVAKAQLGKLKAQAGRNMMESFEFEINRILNAARDDAGNLALNDLV